MTIETNEDFWQAIECTAYAIEGENRQYERERLTLLSGALEKYLLGHAEEKENFAMHAVTRLVHAFVFNDWLGADDPEVMQRRTEKVLSQIMPIKH